MGAFLNLIFAFPTAIFTALLGVVLIYWLLAIVGLVDISHGHVELETGHVEISDVHASHTEITDVSGWASIVVALGLGGVPISIVVSLITLTSWFLSALGQEFLLPLVPALPLGQVLGWGAGIILGLSAFILSIPFTAMAIRPLRRVFVTHNAVSNQSLVGQSCRIITLTVDEKFGRAEVQTGGVSHNVRVWARTPNDFKKGDEGTLAEYNQATGQYLVLSPKELV
jgi:hypothetical protein